jgi:RNA polymerase sigma factor (sigma-70 family)
MSAQNSTALFEAHTELAAKLSKSFPIYGFQTNEVEQEALIALWHAACKYEASKGAFEPFATIVIRNQLRNIFNKVKRHTLGVESLNADALDDDDASETVTASLIDPAANPLLQAERTDIRAALVHELNALTEQQRALIKLYTEGHTFSEIARAKEVSKAAVRQMLFRAMEQVRPELKAKDIDVRFSVTRYGDHIRSENFSLIHQKYARKVHQQSPYKWVFCIIIQVLGIMFLLVRLNWPTIT